MRASPSSGSFRPSMFSARASSFSIASASSDLNTSTRARDNSGAFNSNDGFSVVAPTSTMVPSSITGRKLSCWARLKRWISSTNSSVPLPVSRRARASSNTFFRSATPVKIAEICSKCRSVSCAKSRATVVLPVPGGPQNTSEPSERVASMRLSAPSAPSRWSCPTTSSSLARAQLVGERARRILVEAGGREQRRSRFGARAHPLNTAVICWPPRRMTICQERFGVLVARARSLVLAICSPFTDTMMSPRRKPRLLA